MERLRLGRTGLEVTRLGLGGLQLTKIDPDEGVRVIQAGLDLGVDFVETARGYWNSEEVIGRAIRGRRQRLVLATKSAQRARDDMLADIDASLRALGTDYIDLYQCHSCDLVAEYERIVGPDGALEGLITARRQGKVRAIGFSSHNLELALRILDDGCFASAQLPISFMHRENHERGLFDRARRHDIGLVAMKPFGGGRLGDARLCMGYVLAQPGVLALVGVESVAQVRELVAYAERPPALDAADHAEMERVRAELGTHFCRACKYCHPCPQDIDIFQVLWTPVLVKQMGAQRVLDPGHVERVRRSTDCNGCRACEERCPFGLEIVEALRDCRALIERLVREHGASTGGT